LNASSASSSETVAGWQFSKGTNLNEDWELAVLPIVESLGARHKLASGGDGTKSSKCLSGVVGVDTSRIVESITKEEDEACVGTSDDW